MRSYALKPSVCGLLAALATLREEGFGHEAVVLLNNRGNVTGSCDVEALLQEHGPSHRLWDFQVSGPFGQWRVVRGEATYSMLEDDDTVFLPWDWVLQYTPVQQAFDEFAGDGNNQRRIVNLLQWGKERPSLLDRLRCLITPQQYWRQRNTRVVTNPRFQTLRA